MRYLLPVAALLGLADALLAQTSRTLDARQYHLGVAGMAEWEEFEAAAPHGPQLDLNFSAEPNATEATLLVRQREVKVGWNVLLNGKKLGALETLSQPLVLALRVPAGALRSGENRLTIMRPPSRLADDIVVGEIRLDPRPLEQVLGEATVAITASDADRRAELPCRITIVDERGALAPLRATGEQVAVRTGVVYTGSGRARVNLAAGRYVVYAGRGFEYSVATSRISIRRGEKKDLALRIRREVPTPDLIASDSHIHTLTFSKHGDATLEERMLTIAGEGIELAVATDHNHHADYTESQTRTRTSGHFRSVVGNEVTTKAGHFNAFPVRAGGAIPNAELTDWPQLLANIRSVTGARVITLNHPRDVHANFIPLGADNFDPHTGGLRAAPEFDCDAIEVVTSAAMQSDIMLLYRDWFALLNHGYRVSAVGASDTHDVSHFILGQARTYVRCRAGAADAIDIEEVCASYNQGRLLVSLGLLADMTVDERFRIGDLVTPTARELRVQVDVHGPSWVNADRVELFANGIKIREQAVAPTADPLKKRVRWTLPVPSHDVHLVAIATGPGVTAPYWETPRPYQAASRSFVPRVVGSTNPIWIDADRDGRFSAARRYASKIVEQASGDPRQLVAGLTNFDEAVSVQAAAAWLVAGRDLAAPELQAVLRGAPESVRAAFARVASRREPAR